MELWLDRSSNGWPKRKVISAALLLIWVAAICAASWQYQSARQALVAASDPLTPSDRLSELVHFRGIQAGYELDNRLAANPNTPSQALRELYQRGQLGTQMTLARNPHTPKDLLEQLANHQEEIVRRSLERNPNLPESLRGPKAPAD